MKPQRVYLLFSVTGDGTHVVPFGSAKKAAEEFCRLAPRARNHAFIENCLLDGATVGGRQVNGGTVKVIPKVLV